MNPTNTHAPVVDPGKPTNYEKFTLEEQAFLLDQFKQAMSKMRSAKGSLSPAKMTAIKNQVNAAFQLVYKQRGWEQKESTVVLLFLATASDNYINAILKAHKAQLRIDRHA